MKVIFNYKGYRCKGRVFTQEGDLYWVRYKGQTICIHKSNVLEWEKEG